MGSPSPRVDAATPPARVLEELRHLGLDEPLLGALDRLGLRVRRPLPGGIAGQRRSPRGGSSVEPADFRGYVPGDDVRRLDWGAFARSDRLVVRLNLAEEDVGVTVVVDRSRSMEFGSPLTKAQTATAVSAALIHCALAGYDRACVIGAAGTATRPLPPLRGRSSELRLWRALLDLPRGGSADWRGVARMARRLRPGVTVVIGDLIEEGEIETAVAALRAARQEVVLLQVLAHQELDPDVSGDVRLRDSESGAAVDVTVTPGVLAAYATALRDHTDRLHAIAAAHTAPLVRIVAGAGLRDVLLRDLRRAGILR